jgi:predicted DNA-binding transcriptional regulator
MIGVDDWQTLLADWNEHLLANQQITANLAEEICQSGWLGYPGATEEQIQAAELRLEIELPASYRAFLKVTNGWRNIGYFIYRMRPVEEIEWYWTENKESIDPIVEIYQAMGPISDEDYLVYGDKQRSAIYRAEYLMSAIQISDIGDSAVYLLNPEVRTADREWEAWFFSSWVPGANRFRSFWEMMQSEHKNYKELSAEKILG